MNTIFFRLWKAHEHHDASSGDVAAFFIFIFFKNVFLQKYIFGFIIYNFIPQPPGCGAGGPLPPYSRAVGTYM